MYAYFACILYCMFCCACAVSTTVYCTIYCAAYGNFLGALAGAFWHHSFMAYIGKVLQGQQFGQVLSVVLALQCLTCFCRILPRLSMQERLL